MKADRSVFLSNLFHAYAQTDGTYLFPNSREGDMLKTAKREIENAEAGIRRLNAFIEALAVECAAGIGGAAKRRELESLQRALGIVIGGTDANCGGSTDGSARANFLTPKQCAEQFRLYAQSNPDPGAKHQLNFCANFLDEMCVQVSEPNKAR